MTLKNDEKSLMKNTNPGDFRRERRVSQAGQGMIEYVLIVCLIAVATVGLVGGVSKQLQKSFKRVGVALGASNDGEIQQENAAKWEDPSSNGDAEKMEMLDLFSKSK